MGELHNQQDVILEENCLKLIKIFLLILSINQVNNGIIDSIVIKPGGRCLVRTGLFIAFRHMDMKLEVRGRSGLGLKKGITVLNSPATIDADYAW